MSTFAGVCCAYDDHTWVPTMLEGCYSSVHKLWFLVSRNVWNGPPGDNALTLEKIRTYPDPDNKIGIVEGDWINEADQRNYGLELCASAGIDYCFVVDADEIYDPSALALMMALTELRSDVGVWRASFWAYWKTYRYRIENSGKFLPSVFVKIGQGRFVRNRLTVSSRDGIIPPSLGMCHHMAYARPDHEIFAKVLRSRLSEHNVPNWFEDVWKRWDREPNLENLHPRHPPAYRRAILQDPDRYPPALRRLYERECLGSL